MTPSLYPHSFIMTAPKTTLKTSCPFCHQVGLFSCIYGQSHLFMMFNKYPYAPGSFLLVSHACRPQNSVSKDDLVAILHFQRKMNKDSAYRIYTFFNMFGSGASVAHYHHQGILLPEQQWLPIEVAETKKILDVRGVQVSKSLDYPMYGLSVSGSNYVAMAEVTSKIIQELKTPYNLSMSLETIRIIPRGETNKEISAFLKTVSNDSDYSQRIGGLEVSGMFQNQHQGLWENIALGLPEEPTDYHFFWNALNELGFSIEQQYELENKLRRVF